MKRKTNNNLTLHTIFKRKRFESMKSKFSNFLPTVSLIYTTYISSLPNTRD